MFQYKSYIVRRSKFDKVMTGDAWCLNPLCHQRPRDRADENRSFDPSALQLQYGSDAWCHFQVDKELQNAWSQMSEIEMDREIHIVCTEIHIISHHIIIIIISYHNHNHNISYHIISHQLTSYIYKSLYIIICRIIWIWAKYDRMGLLMIWHL